MFRNLYDYISLLFSWRWPKAEGVITAVDLRAAANGDGGANRLRLVIVFKFCLGDDGPYTGESLSPYLSNIDLVDVNQQLRTGRPVAVRYRPDDPSVNRLDLSVWQDFESL